DRRTRRAHGRRSPSSLRAPVSQVGDTGTFHDTLDVEPAREVCEQPASPAEEHGDQVQLQLVEKSGTQTLPDRSAAVEPDVFVSGGASCLLDRGLESVGGEVERRTLPDVVGAPVVGEHEDGHFERWVWSPRGFGMAIAVHAHDQGAGALELLAQDVVGGELTTVGDV